MKDNEHDIGVSERVAREELAPIEAQPGMQMFLTDITLSLRKSLTFFYFPLSLHLPSS